ncbi:hypothetical protein GPM19_09315 [Halomonas sp. ZH2S]|uniref:Phasin domain-containing protein n=1 Tax=Vreelandella zhuhanensis TaxID=2684210 RepID=A0A7X3H2E9_9GAMM|nr:phasin family protein [Halomonas zhuhanensis]MWJ28403.1 hypothetical protein [Halomonas zhuhanensis]
MDSNEKTTENVEQAAELARDQFANAVVEPARAYGSLALEYYQKLFSTQLNAIREFTDASLEQSRSWLEVKDSDGFRKVMEDQQKALQNLNDRFKADAEEITALNQEYMQKSMKLMEDNMQKGQKQFEENMQKGQRQLEETMQQGQKQVEKNMQKGQSQQQKQSEGSKKSSSSSSSS